MANENLEFSIKKSFDNIVPDIKRKEEIYNKLISEVSTKEAEKPSFFSKFTAKFPRILPYAVVCACLLLVIGITFSGGFDNMFIEKSAETAAYALETTAESTSYAADAELIEDRMIKNEAESYVADDCDAEFPEAANENAEDDNKTSLSHKFQILEDYGQHSYDIVLNEYDPMIIWEQYKELTDNLNGIELISYEFDELNNIIILDFNEETVDLLKKNYVYNQFIAVGETYRELYPDYRFSVKANSELLMIEGKQVDFKSHYFTYGES